MFEQITLHRSEVLTLLRRIYDIRTALFRSVDRFYQKDYDDIETQLLEIRSQVDAILQYFLLEHQIDIPSDEHLRTLISKSK